ncbi:MAG TPA: PQQ-binding-like beta-propeller repeat protein [Planctomycetota bacterium]
MTLVPALLALLAGAPQLGEDEATRFFALPMVRDTQELADVAERHVAAGRFPEAVQALQRILEQHAHEVLAPGRGPGGNATHVGAAEWALARLFTLPEEARAEYRARFEPRAAEALARARAAPERSSLAAIPRRWPLTPSAVAAWWTLGDLELECGRPEAAELAWQRAVDLAAKLGSVAPVSPARAAWLTERARARAALRTPPPTLPRGDAEHWTLALDLTPFQKGSAIGKNLQPIAVDDVVLVGSTLRLFAVDAYSGELRWEAGPPRGWSALSRSSEASLFDGVGEQLLYLAPAAEHGIAVAVMQQPFTENESEDWQGIQIMVAIPERRLHAYDLATGAELWSHAPELDYDARNRRWLWDGGGSYAQRMMIAGSPVLAGARVLVPSYRMQGRIDYHVACYELATGALLWSTQLISGQRERNMFGRSVSEFCAAPLVVVGDRVLAQTELGTLAALDLFTGHIQWQAIYPQIPLPKTRSYQPPPRQVTWRLAPPVVVGELVIATPSDSDEIVALRLRDGAPVWSYREEALQELDPRTRALGFRQLLGADEGALYLAGSKLSALYKPGGLAGGADFHPGWTVPLDRPDTSPRAVLFGEHVVAPSPLRREVLLRRTGERVPALSGSWSGGEVGNVFVADGALFSLSNQGLSGYFDWNVRLERARRTAGPGAGQAELLAAAELFARRGALCLAQGELEPAQQALEEARGLYARARELVPGVTRTAELDCAANLAETLFRRQREEAALAVLTEARALATGPAERLPLLLREERIRRSRGGAARLAVLDEIARCAGQATLAEDQRLEVLLAWLPEPREVPPEPRGDPLPLALWVALERAAEHERAGALAPALAELHEALWACGELELVPGVALGAVARARISALLTRPEAAAAYAPLEARAQELLVAARAERSDAAFALVGARYPHSRAAREALLARLEHAGDPLATARLLAEVLGQGGLGAELAADLRARLAEALGRAGNAAFEAGQLAALARTDPARPSPLAAHGGRTFAELAAARAAQPPGPAPAPVRFGRLASGGNALLGTIEYLGALRPESQDPESAPLELHLYARKDELLAFESSAPAEPAWRRPLEEPFASAADVTACGAERFHYGVRERIVCLDLGGEERWSQPTPDEPTRALASSDGVLVARLRSNRVAAFDERFGLALWSRTLEGASDWSGPLAGDGHAVFFQRLPAQGTRALVLDLFRGEIAADLRLPGQTARGGPEDTAWIEAGRLIVPEFQERPARLAAYSLEDGRRAWTIELGRDEELQAIVHADGQAFPVTLAAALDAGATNGGVYELDARLGSVRRVVPLKPGERLLGVTPGSSVHLTDPYVFPFTYAESERSVPIRAVHLRQGLSWTWSLPIAPQEVYDPRNLALPALSEELVALAYQARRAGGSPAAEATIVLLDRRTGRKVDTLLLGERFAQSSRLALRGLGDALFVTGQGSPSRGAGLEILETLR